MTALEAIQEAFEDAGVNGPTDALQGHQTALGLRKINRIVNAWNALGLIPPVEARSPYALTSGLGTYTVGASGTLVGPRPYHLQRATIMFAGSTREYPLEILTKQRYDEVPDKGLTGSFPQRIHVQPTPGPNATVIILDAPSVTGMTLVLYTKQQLARFADLVTDYALKEGYESALKAALTVAIAASVGRPITPDMQNTADVSFARISESNVEPEEMDGTGGFPALGGFDITTGEEF